MEWTIRLEARTGWGEVACYEIGCLRRGLHDLSSEDIGLTLAEAKALLAELQQRIVQDQVAEYVTCARVCPDCMALRRLRDRRTRTLQTLFGTVTVAAPRIRLCSCADTFGMADMSFSPLHGRAVPVACRVGCPPFVPRGPAFFHSPGKRRFAVKRMFPVNAPFNAEHAAVLRLIAADLALPLDAVYIGDGASGPAVFYRDRHEGTRSVCAVGSPSWQARVEAAALLSHR